MIGSIKYKQSLRAKALKVLSIKGIIVVLLLVLPSILYTLYSIPIVYAACPDGQTETELGCVPNNPIGATKLLYGVGLGLVGGVGLLFIIYGAYLILSSQGDPGQLQKGKSYIVYSIIGIILAVAGFALYQIISVDILKLPGFSR